MVTQTQQSPAKQATAAGGQGRRVEGGANVQVSITSYLSDKTNQVNAGVARVVRSVGRSVDLESGMEASAHSTPREEKRKRTKSGSNLINGSMITQTSLLSESLGDEETVETGENGGGSDDDQPRTKRPARDEGANVEEVLKSIDGIRSLTDNVPEVDVIEEAAKAGFGASKGEMTKEAEKRRVMASLGAISKKVEKSKEIGGEGVSLSWDNEGDIGAGSNVEMTEHVDPEGDLAERVEEGVSDMLRKEIDLTVRASTAEMVQQMIKSGQDQQEAVVKLQEKQNQMMLEKVTEVAVRKTEVEQIAFQMQQLNQQMFKDHGERVTHLDEYVKSTMDAVAKFTISDETARALTASAVKAAEDAVSGKMDAVSEKVSEVQGMVEKIKDKQIEEEKKAKAKEDQTVKEMAQMRVEINGIKESAESHAHQVEEVKAMVVRKMEENSSRIDGVVRSAEEAIGRIEAGGGGEMNTAVESMGEDLRGRIRLNTSRVDDTEKKIEELQAQVRELTGLLQQRNQNGVGMVGGVPELPEGVTPEMLISVCKQHVRDQDNYWRRSCMIVVHGEVFDSDNYHRCKRILSRVHLSFMIKESESHYVSNSGKSIRITFSDFKKMTSFTRKAKSVCYERQIGNVRVETLVPPRLQSLKHDLLNIGRDQKNRGDIRHYEVVVKKGQLMLRTVKQNGEPDFMTVAQPGDSQTEPMEEGEEDEVQSVVIVEEEKCPVCQEAISDTTHGPVMTQNKCGHKIHQWCALVNYLTNGLDCTVCRQTQDELASKVECDKCIALGPAALVSEKLRCAPCGHLHSEDCLNDWFQVSGENWRSFTEEDLKRYMAACKIYCFHCTRVSVPEMWSNIGCSPASGESVQIQIGDTAVRRGGGRGGNSVSGAERGVGRGRGSGPRPFRGGNSRGSVPSVSGGNRGAVRGGRYSTASSTAVRSAPGVRGNNRGAVGRGRAPAASTTAARARMEGVNLTGGNSQQIQEVEEEEEL